VTKEDLIKIVDSALVDQSIVISSMFEKIESKETLEDQNYLNYSLRTGEYEEVLHLLLT
jgi:hypothetical protein